MSEFLNASTNQAMQGQQLVGKGYTSDVYAWGEGRVLKLFHSRIPKKQVEREYTVARAVHAAGVTAPCVDDLIQVDERYGIVFERIDGTTMFEQVQERPWTLFRAIRQLADLHAQIHRCLAPDELPSQRAWFASRIETAHDLSEEQKQAAFGALERMPDGTALCHGDFHPGNIVYTERGPIIIDWDRATRGDPLGDVACTSQLLRSAGLPPWAPRYMHLLLKCFRSLLHRSYISRSIRFHGATRQQIESWELVLSHCLTEEPPPPAPPSAP